MKKELTAVERLNLAAKLYSTNPVREWRWVLLYYALISFRRTTLTWSFHGTSLWIVGGLAAITLLFLWSRWRYNAYVLAAVFFATASFVALTGKPLAHNWADWASILLFAFSGVFMVTIARRYSMVHSEGWENERIQLDRWLTDIKRGDDPEIIRFSAGNFWIGYWTYALYNPGDCWVVARFRKNTTKLGSCRVYGPDDVVIRETLSGRHDIEIGQRKKKLFANVELGAPSLGH